MLTLLIGLICTVAVIFTCTAIYFRKRSLQKNRNHFNSPNEALTTPPHILLIDPNAETQRATERALHLLGCQTDSTHAEEAIEYARVRMYDMILLDLDQPENAVYSVLSAIRGFTDERGMTPIVALYEDLDHEAERILRDERGVNDFVKKPISLEDLRRMLGTHVVDPSMQDVANGMSGILCQLDEHLP